MIFYKWLGNDDLDADDVVNLPVAFRVFGTSANFDGRRWKYVAEIIGFREPSESSQAMVEWAAPLRGSILRWSGRTGLEVVPSKLELMTGLPLAPECSPDEYADRVRASIAGEYREPVFDVKTFVPETPDERFDPFELFPNSNEWADELLSFDDVELVAAIDDALTIPSTQFLDRDVLGPALMAATILASPTNLDPISMFDPLPRLVNRTHPIASASLLAKASFVVLQTTRVGSDYSTERRNFRTFIAALERRISSRLAASRT